MNFTSENGQKLTIREYQTEDYVAILQLNKLEGWTTLVERAEDTEEAFENSNVAYVVVLENKIVGYLRGLTDTRVTLYVCELIIGKEIRGSGVGTELLEYVHNLYPNTRMELLGLSTSRAFYEKQAFRSFYGFRKTKQE